MKKQKKKSPIKKKALRIPGQSLDEQLDDILYDKILMYLIASIFFIAMAGIEWWKFYRDAPPSPVIVTFFAVGIVIYSAVRIFLLKDTIKSLKQGRHGERVVGQLLESMREGGCKVFHDLKDWGSKDSNFNVDHVLVCDRGVFVVDTKTHSKPMKGEAIIEFTGEKLFIDSKENIKILPQANAQKRWMERLINRESGLKIPVKPIVAFPGWFIKGAGNNKASKYDLWVLEPKALPAFISNLPVSISAEDKTRIANCLSNYVRREQK